MIGYLYQASGWSPGNVGGTISRPISLGRSMANRLRASGEAGSRSDMIRPIVRWALGSTSSTAQVCRGIPKNRSNCRGTIEDHRPELACEHRLKIELVSTEGLGWASTDRKMPRERRWL